MGADSNWTSDPKVDQREPLLSFSVAGLARLGGLSTLDSANEAAQPSNSIFMAGLLAAVVLSTLSLVATHLKKP